MYKYVYNGPVKEFDRLINERWYAETTAVSANKAKSNLKYRYKKEHNLVAGSKIELPGEVTLIS